MNFKPQAASDQASEPNWMFPTEAILKDCQSQCEGLGLPFDFSELVAHVRETRLAHQCDPGKYSPSFYAVRILPPIQRLSGRDRRVAASLKHALGHLESCVAYCIACKEPEVKPLAAFLHEAQCSCERAMRATQDARDQEQRFGEARKQGGQSRQAKLRPARLKVAEVFRAQAPVGGWRSFKEALKAVVPPVREFILTERISMAIGDNLSRTVGKWILEDPEFAAICRTATKIRVTKAARHTLNDPLQTALQLFSAPMKRSTDGDP